MTAPTHDTLSALRAALGSVIVGKSEAIDLLLVGLLGAGHVLIEDVPGVGKTTLAKALARVLDVPFTRVQFTPDLLPADILGAEVLNPKDGSFRFHRGPIFTSVLLADEINRASPRTQSALLEAMNERQVTVEGHSYQLDEPFIVIATQNPVDFQGTYPLPEAQLDRFILRLKMGYPDLEAELQVLTDRQTADPIASLDTVITSDAVATLQAEVRGVAVKELVARYLLQIVHATRQHPGLELGVSPRGALSHYRAAQARALLEGRDYVTPDDVQSVAVPVLAHRVMPTQRARYGGRSVDTLVQEIVADVPVPT